MAVNPKDYENPEQYLFAQIVQLVRDYADFVEDTPESILEVISENLLPVEPVNTEAVAVQASPEPYVDSFAGRDARDFEQRVREWKQQGREIALIHAGQLYRKQPGVTAQDILDAADRFHNFLTAPEVDANGNVKAPDPTPSPFGDLTFPKITGINFG